MRKKLYVSQIKDVYIQDNFQTLGAVLGFSPFLKGEWQFLTYSIKATASNLLLPHTLKFQPLDVILLSAIGGSMTFNYNLFDKVNLNVNATVTTAPLVVRLIVGRYTEEQVNV